MRAKECIERKHEAARTSLSLPAANVRDGSPWLVMYCEANDLIRSPWRAYQNSGFAVSQHFSFFTTTSSQFSCLHSPSQDFHHACTYCTLFDDLAHKPTRITAQSDQEIIAQQEASLNSQAKVQGTAGKE